MGRPINNLRKASIRIKINQAGYKKLVALGDRVLLFMTGNLNFSTPLPALAGVQTDLTGLKNATANMGQKRSRASKTELQDATTRATVVRDELTALLNYVIQTCLVAHPTDIPAFNQMLGSSGFAMKDTRSLTARTQQPTFTRQTNNKIYNGATNGQVRINWRKPLGLLKGKPIAGYNVIIGGVVTQTVTKCNAMITLAPGNNADVTIQPFNFRGTGQTVQIATKAVYN